MPQLRTKSKVIVSGPPKDDDSLAFDDSHRTPSPIVIAQIEELKKRFEKGTGHTLISQSGTFTRFVADDPLATLSTRCDPRAYYKKPVIVVAPDLQFKAEFSLMTCKDCDAKLTLSGWHDRPRYIHGVECGEYMIQKR
jgi:hypothetical protein